MKVVRVLNRVGVHLVLIFLCVIAVYPVYYMLITALKTRAEYFTNPFGLPHQISFEQMLDLLERGLFRQIGNTALITVLSCILGIALAVLAAYAFAKMRFRGQAPLFNVIVALLAMPGIVVIVPLYATMAALRLLNTYIGISLVYAGFMFPFSVFVLTSFFRTVPKEIMDAAEIDGCGEFMTLLRIVVPMSSASLVTLFVINALGVWNEFLVALLFLQRNELRTIVVAVAMMRDRYSANVPGMLSASLFVGLPVMIAYVLGQKYFVKGFASGAIK